MQRTEEILLAKPVSCSNGLVLTVVALNAGKAKQTVVLISFQDSLICSQTKVPCSHIDLHLAEPIQGISYHDRFKFKVVKDHTS